MTQRLLISAPQISTTDGQVRIEAAFITPDGTTHPFYVSWSGEQIPSAQSAGDAMLAFGLVPAMAMGLDLHIQAPVSQRLLHQSRIIHDFLISWHPEQLTANTATADQPSPDFPAPDGATETGCFFTGGIDSHHTLLAEKHQIDSAIYVHGYDLKLDDVENRKIATQACRTACEATGIQLIEVETNVRHFTDQFTNWTTVMTGSGLAGIAHLLAGQCDRIFIPSTTPYENPYPAATLPLLDRQWDTPNLQVIHHGSDFDLIEKTQQAAKFPAIASTLRVCTDAPNGQRNCGRCEKCCRTLLAFEAIGERQKILPAFSDPATTKEAIAVPVHRDQNITWFDWECLHRHAAQHAPELAAQLKKKLLARECERLTANTREQITGTINSTHWEQRVQKFRKKILLSMTESDPEWFQQHTKKNLPKLRQALATSLKTDHPWLKKKLRKATWSHRLRIAQLFKNSSHLSKYLRISASPHLRISASPTSAYVENHTSHSEQPPQANQPPPSH